MNRGLRTAIISLACAALAACASAQRTSLEPTIADAGRALSAGDYQGSIDLYKKACASDRTDKRVITEYVRAVEDIKCAADRALDMERFGSAAMTYGVLLRNWPDFSAIAGRLSFDRGAVQDGLKSCRVGTCDERARQELAAGNYDRPLALYQAALKDYPGDPALRAGYAAAVREIQAAGAKALASHDYAGAGRALGVLLAHLAALEASGVAVGLDRMALEAALRTCSANLINRGLEEYRKGDLEKAISVWESLLVFEPHNTEIKKAVETARAQLSKLRAAPPVGRSPVHSKSSSAARY